MAQQTAVEWFWIYLPENISKEYFDLFEQAKQMEKEQIGQFMNWFIKHYSTATIDGMFGWVDSMEKEVTLKEILDDYYN
jgi:hypothetical protein